jgi:hypothetical protein
MKKATFDPEINSCGSQASDNDMHEEIEKYAQTSDAMQNVSVALDTPATTC